VRLYYRKDRRQWWADWTLDGQRTRIALRGVASKKEAETAAGILYSDAAKRAMLGDAVPTTAEKLLTLGTLLERHAKRAGIADKTRVWEGHCRIALLDHFEKSGPRKVATLRAEDIQVFREEQEDAGAAPRSIAMRLQVLRGALRWAHKTGMTSKVPCAVALPPVEGTRRRVLSADEVNRVIAEAEKLGIGDETTFQAMTGLRKGELYSAKWGHVDFDRASLSVECRKRGATGAVRVETIPLLPAALEVLKRRRSESSKPDEFIFGKRPEERNARLRRKAKGAVGTVEGVEVSVRYAYGRTLKKAAKAAGIDWWQELRPHDLRHALVTNLLASGASLADASRMARHTKVTTTLDVYAHCLDGNLRESLAKIGFKSPAKIVEVSAISGDNQSLAPIRHQPIEGTKERKAGIG